MILLALFFIQRRGSGAIGFLFGPVILVWFIAIGLLGLNQVLKDPAVFQALSPTWGARFLADHGAAGFLTLGGVVLAVTGAETLYADRGHFGAGPIRLGWFAVAFPALMLNYLGQGVLIRDDPSTAVNPFFLMVPGWAQYPMLFLATAATIIASQAAISGSFSVARQAVQLGYLPRLTVLHPSKVEGQIYVPIVNWGLCIGVITLALVFQSADKLGDIYGVAVTGTFILNTLLFAAVARLLWGTPKRRLVPIVVLFLTVEVAFFAANIAKVEHGAWLPLVDRAGDLDRDDQLAPGAGDRHPQSDRQGGVPDRVPGRLSAEDPHRPEFPAWPSTSIQPRRPPRWRSGSRSRTPTRSTRGS